MLTSLFAKGRGRSARGGLIFVLLGLAALWPGFANAQHTSTECPAQTASVTAGGSVTINISDCEAVSGLGGDGAIDGGSYGPSDTEDHGTATTRHTGGQWYLDYSNNGTGIGSTDVFELSDGSLTGAGDIRFTITINPSASPITVAPASLPTLKAGTAFSQSLSSSGGLAPYTYALQSGTLPPGISLSSAGVLSGTPTQRGAYSFSVRSTDSTTPTAQFVDKGYTGTVQNPTLSLATPSGTAIQSTGFSQTLSTSGGVAPYTYALETGTFPAGISVSSAGVVSGTTAGAPGNYPVTIRVTDASTGPGAYFELENYTLTVSPPPSISISVSPASVSEDGATNLAFTVTRSLNLTSPTVVNITTSGTATPGTDYTGNVASVTIPAGATTATIVIDPTADGTVEPDETVTLTVDAGTGYAVGIPNSATGTIVNTNMPELTLSKWTSASPWTVGVAASYTLQVSNTGTAATTAVATITDTIPIGLTIGTLPAACTAAGQTVTCTIPAGLVVSGSIGFVIPVTPTAAAGASVTNTATVSGGGDPTCPAAAHCTSTAGPTTVNAPVLTLIKSASASPWTVGVAASYTLQVSNTGTAATTAVATITDTIPTGLTIGTLPAGCTPAGQTVTCTFVAGLAAGATMSFVIPVTPTAAAGASVTNMATVSGGGDPTCPAAAHCTSTAGPTPMSANADVAIVKSQATPNPAVPGQAVTWTITVTNNGPSDAAGVQTADMVPASVTGLTVGGADAASCTVAGQSVTCNFGTVANGTTRTYTITGTLAANFTGTLNNTATVTSTTSDPAPGNNSATSSTPTTALADAAIVNTLLTASPVAAGGSVSYQIVVTNAGPSNLIGASVANTVPTELTGVTWNCTAAGSAACGMASGSGNIATTVDVTAGAGNGVTFVVTGTAPTTTPSTVSATTATVTPPVGTNDPNPGNNSSTVTSIPVTANVIDAMDDTGTVPNGAAGGGGVPNVLVNDTLSGAPATVATMTITQVSTSNPNVTLNPATGALIVAPGTPAGTYTLVYQICEQLNPTNCDTATVTVTVGAAVIDAMDDTGTVPNGAAGGVAVPNVLVNDTLSGTPATLATVTITQVSTSNPNVTLNPATGAVNVAPGTPAGTYTLVYQICEQLNPTNCDTAFVTVTVGAAVIDAVDDSYGPVNGASGGTTGSVLANDTLGGSPATVGAGGNVTLFPGAAPTPAAGSITMNQDGTITIAPGTTAGPYTYAYTICEVLNPMNCDTATVTVTVGAAVIDAVDDTGTVASGAAGGTAVPNVLVNDTLSGAPATLATVTITQVSTSNPNVTLNPATGAVIVAPGTPAGSYTLVYQLCEQLNLSNCDTAIVTVTISEPPPLANNSTLTVPYNAPATNVPLSLSGGAATSLAITTAPLHGTALVSGTTISYQPIAGYAGEDTFAYTATNSGGTSAPATVSVTVNDPSTTITPSGGFSATVASPYSQTFTFAGGATPWSGYQVTNLPAGLSITATTASSVTISGTPTQAGSFNLNVSATDSSSGNGPYTVGQAFTLTVAAPTLTLSPAATTFTPTYGAPYSQSFTASGGVGPYTYAATGTLPTGLTLSGNTVSGTPTQPGNHVVSITATDTGSTGTGSPFTVQQSYTFNVAAPTIVVAPATLPNPVANAAYSHTLTASGGVAPYGFAVTAGSLPPGIVLANSGTLSGTTSQVGTYNFTVTAADNFGQTGSRAYSVTIAAPTLTMTPAPGTLTASYGAAYSQSFTASGGSGNFSYAVTGALPAGLSFSGNTLSGTPTVPGSYPITVTATDTVLTGAGAPFTVSNNYTINVPAPTITVSPATLPNTTAGLAYSQSLSATGGVGPYAFAVTAGTLPTGLSLSSGGALSGSATASGTFNFTVTAADSFGQSGSQAYSVVVAVPILTVTPATLPNGTAGVAYTQALTVSGGIAPYTATLTGTLPTGISFNIATLTFSGTPTQSGTFNVSVTITDNTGGAAATVTNNYTLTIAVPTLTMTPAAGALPGGTGGVAYSQAFTATGGIAPYSYAVASGTLPAGLSLNASTGVLSGTPAAAGSFAFSIRATDSTTGTPATVTNDYTLAISAPTITINPPTLPNGMFAVPYTHVLNAVGGTSPYTFAISEGALPTGVTLSASGNLGGTPSVTGSFNFTVRATDALGFTGTRAYSIAVNARPDPAQDPDVRGLLQAQIATTRRMAEAQAGNFRNRMESLHDGGTTRGFSNHLSVAMRQPCVPDLRLASGQRCREAPANTMGGTASGASATGAAGNEHAFGTWIGGSVRSGALGSQGATAGLDFETDGISVGIDRRSSPRFAAGVGVGYGRDQSTIGHDGATLDARANTFAVYASLHPEGQVFADALFGYQSFDYRMRRTSSNGAQVRGQRDGNQLFTSLTVGAEMEAGKAWTWTPYGRLDLMRATLDAYSESGDPIYALQYEDMDVDSRTGTLGLKLQGAFATEHGLLEPQFRLEYQHDFQADAFALIRYADGLGPVYRADFAGFDRNRFAIGLGLMFRTQSGWGTRMEYRGLTGSDGRDNGLNFSVEKDF